MQHQRESACINSNREGEENEINGALKKPERQLARMYQEGFSSQVEAAVAKAELQQLQKLTELCRVLN